LYYDMNTELLTSAINTNHCTNAIIIESPSETNPYLTFESRGFLKMDDYT